MPSIASVDYYLVGKLLHVLLFAFLPINFKEAINFKEVWVKKCFQASGLNLPTN